jgi:hypothetical protein
LDARPVRATMQHRGTLYVCSYCRMARVDVMPSITGMDMSGPTVSNDAHEGSTQLGVTYPSE